MLLIAPSGMSATFIYYLFEREGEQREQNFLFLL